MSQSCTNAVRKKLCPKFIHDFKGFGKLETFEAVTENIVKLVEGLEIEVDEHDVEELIDSQGEELLNEERMESKVKTLLILNELKLWNQTVHNKRDDRSLS